MRFSWPKAFARALDGLSEDVPLTGSTADNIVRGFLNKFVFPLFGTELPQGYIDLFSIKSPGIIADRSVLILVIGIAVIAALEISRSWFSILYLVVFCFLVRMAGSGEDGLYWNGDVILALLSGGTLVAAFILVVDPSSGAKSAAGNAIAVILAAVLSFAFRYAGNVFYGCFFAVALVNALIPLLAKLERRLFYSAGASKGGGA
jgi:electron transport complex protein RnfD